jgi:hypothetical protein
MNDKGKILGGLIVFLALLTSPIWYNMASGKAKTKPKLELTEKAKQAKKCVMPTPFMRAQHMDLLNQWREQVVRDGDRIHKSPDGRKFNKSLVKTCLDCHSNKDKFCDVCHKYSAVDEPTCYNCHLVPEKAEKTGQGGN